MGSGKRAIYVVVAVLVVLGGAILFLNNFRQFGQAAPPSVTGETAAPSDQKR
jgi:hypothetical protein